jgi:hypothetical protein
MEGAAVSNSFERFAETQMVAATKAKYKAAETRERKAKVKVLQSEKDAPMKLSPLEQKMEDSSRQMRIYRRIKRAELRARLEGTQAEQWRALIEQLKALTIEDGDALVDYVQAQDWIREADLDTRYAVLSLIADVIIRLRVRNGYSPIDDSLPGEPPTVFEIIRSELRVMT